MTYWRLAQFFHTEIGNFPDDFKPLNEIRNLNTPMLETFMTIFMFLIEWCHFHFKTGKFAQQFFYLNKLCDNLLINEKQTTQPKFTTAGKQLINTFLMFPHPPLQAQPINTFLMFPQPPLQAKQLVADLGARHIHIITANCILSQHILGPKFGSQEYLPSAF